MRDKKITIQKNGQEAQIVESSFKVWKEKGWTKKDETKTQVAPKPPESKADKS